MKIFRLFTIAAAALMMSACSEDIAQMINGGKKEFTATLAAPNKGGTRTVYTEDTQNNKITVAWKVGDEIALIHNGVKDVATVKTINADGSATITGDITKANNDEAVEVCYPAAAWEWNAETSGAIRNAEFVSNINAQDGTLKYIQDNLDVRMGKGTLKVDGDKATLSDNVTLASQIAIWKLTMQDDATPTPAALKASQVSVKLGGEEPWTVAGTTTLGTATSTVYLAIDKLENQYLTIEATVGSDTYKYENEDISLALGQYYQSTVTMAKAAIDLSTLTAAYEAQNGDVLTGTLAGNYKISIAAGATVTLDGVTINGVDDSDYSWAGITCLGDATIILKDGTTNTVNGFDQNYPGIYVPGDAENPANNKTLTIKGTGSLTANCHDKNGRAAGIGGNSDEACGNIVIAGGTINATGGLGAGIGSGKDKSCGAITISGGTVSATSGSSGAGIGSGHYGKCGDILISGGTVSATGGSSGAYSGAGIGSGNGGSCGDITITSGVTSVTATKGSGADNSIGKGRGGSCGTVTIGGTVYWNGSAYQNGGDTYLTQSTIVYPSPFANVTASDLGKVIGADGNIYADATAAEAASTTAVAVICYVGDAGTADASSATYKGLALALTDANSGNSAAWCSQTSNTCLGTQYDNETAAKGDMAGIANTDALVGHATHTHAAASAARGYNSGTHPTGTSAWFLPSAGQWEKMIAAAGNYSALITRASLKSDDNYWSSSELSSYFAWRYDVWGSGWGQDSKDISRYVRACLAF